MPYWHQFFFNFSYKFSNQLQKELITASYFSIKFSVFASKTRTLLALALQYSSSQHWVGSVYIANCSLSDIQAYIFTCLLTGDADYDCSDKEGKSIDEMIHALVGFLKSQIAFYMQHVSASHVLRVLIEVLSGCQVSDRVIRGNNSQRRKVKSKLILIKRILSYGAWLAVLINICNNVTYIWQNSSCALFKCYSRWNIKDIILWCTCKCHGVFQLYSPIKNILLKYVLMFLCLQGEINFYSSDLPRLCCSSFNIDCWSCYCN